MVAAAGDMLVEDGFMGDESVSIVMVTKQLPEKKGKAENSCRSLEKKEKTSVAILLVCEKSFRECTTEELITYICVKR